MKHALVAAALSAVLLTLVAGCGTTSPSPGPSPSAVASAPPSAPPAPSALPTAIEVPRINAVSSLYATGLDEEGYAEVPPITSPMQASYLGWAEEESPVRPLVVYGHVDGRDAQDRSVPGIFNRLDELEIGDQIRVMRANNMVTVYQVTNVVEVSKDENTFPTEDVYGEDPTGIRLITCGGPFDRSSGHYENNIIVVGTRLA